MEGLCRHCGMAPGDYHCINTQRTYQPFELSLISYLYKCRRLGLSSVLRKYLEEKQTNIIKQQNTFNSAAAAAVKNMQRYQNVLHEVPLMIVRQDAGDVPVPRRQGLKYVCAGVGLGRKHTGETSKHNTVPSLQGHIS